MGDRNGDGGRKGDGEVADPKEENIDKTLLHYITPDAPAHRLDLITLMRVAYRARASFRASSYFPIYARRGKISQISGKTFLARECVFAAVSTCDSGGFFPPR